MHTVILIHAFLFSQSFIKTLLSFLKCLLLKTTKHIECVSAHDTPIAFMQTYLKTVKAVMILTLYHCGFCISLVSLCVVRIRQALSADTAPSRMACLESHTA